MARQANGVTLKWACHLSIKGVARQYQFPEKMSKAQALERDTWCRRRGTPSSHHHLGVPLEDSGVARQHQKRPSKVRRAT
ncbi:hypothetical protein AHAS_Ahas04G0108500 [Arachis hypogaea]